MLTIIIAPQILTHLFFIWAQKIKNWAVIDTAWSLGFIVTVITSMITYKNYSLSSMIVALLVSIWALRLSVFLFKRNHGKPEDWRYTQFREEWKPNENIHGYLKVFVFQGILMFVVTLPQIFFIKSGNTLKLGALECIGLGLWLFGMIFEVLADNQLENFKNNPNKESKFMTKGVWSLSRHPNYFGEVTIWFGFYIMLFNYIPSWTIIGPLIITFFIANVTGIPLFEKKYSGNLEFEAYKERTNMFFPWFPKK